jgi:hypothetical protein
MCTFVEREARDVGTINVHYISKCFNTASSFQNGSLLGHMNGCSNVVIGKKEKKGFF